VIREDDIKITIIPKNSNTKNLLDFTLPIEVVKDRIRQGLLEECERSRGTDDPLIIDSPEELEFAVDFNYELALTIWLQLNDGEKQ